MPFHYESAPPAWHVLSLRDRQYIQDQLDVFNILGPMESVTQKLDEGIVDFFTRRKKTFLLPKKTEQGAYFWKIVHSDLSWQLDDPVRSGLFSMKVPKQSLPSYPPYSNALVVRDPFRCFTREDGKSCCQRISCTTLLI